MPLEIVTVTSFSKITSIYLAGIGSKHKIGVFLGEFGANKNAEEPYRKMWTGAVRKQADEYDFAWGYWELCSVFGIYDSETGQWDKDILSQLIPD